MELNEEILNQFLTGKCNRQQESAVVEELRKNPDLLEQYLISNPLFLREEFDRPLPESFSDRLFEQIHATILRKKRRPQRVLYRIGAAAAVLLVMIGLWQFGIFRKHNMESGPMILESKIVSRNNSDTTQIWTLPDKSVVEAAPGAILSYASNFDGRKRDVYLNGAATFDIVHDPQRPFTVYSNKISTTVLGTKFSVNSEYEKIEVKLYEGKVMVKSLQDKIVKPIYLDPGNAVIYTIATGRFLAVSNFDRKNRDRRLVEYEAAESKAELSTNVIEFENISMETAIDRLAEIFEAEIQYSPIDIDGVNLIAQVTKKQSLKKILQDIALTNGLEVKEIKKDVFVLMKMPANKSY